MNAMEPKRLIRRVLGWIGWTVLILLILWVGLLAMVAYYQPNSFTAEQQTALRLMNSDYYWRPANGVNAFPLLWYMGYDVPNNWLDKQMAVDVGKVKRQLSEDMVSINNKPDAVPLPELSKEEMAVLCDTSGKGCLAKVTAHPDAVRTVLAAHPALLARAQIFEHTDFYWDEFPAYYRHSNKQSKQLSKEFIININRAQDLWLSSFALQYVNGDHGGALAATCRHILAWRHMAYGSNSLFGSTALVSTGMDLAIGLYAEMLTDLPSDETVPDDCTVALQPVVAADVDRCAALAGDFALTKSMIHNSRAAGNNSTTASRTNMIDLSQAEVWVAQILAASCGDHAVMRLLADEHPYRPSVRSFFGFPWTKGMACVFNIRGCKLIAVAIPYYDGYDSLVLDNAAHLRLAATLLWLREHPGGSVSERFEHRPAELRSPHHKSGFDAKNNMLYVENFDQEPAGENKQFSLPVAAASQ
ncbi:MAG: hypothetical protein LBH31_04795 [Burkholderiaceae bacterium]|jgi:hypothetical protein|nr:hypothetical protein [Burkholderiaceae bacterium]